MISFNNILCPTDFSKESQEATRYAIKMADPQNTTIHLLHILEIPFLLDPQGLNYYTQLASTLKKEAEEKLYVYITDLKTKFPAYSFTSEIMENPDPAKAIVDSALHNVAEMIVMSSHGRKGWDRLLMGSVAESVMRMSDIPVVIIKIKPAQLQPRH